MTTRWQEIANALRDRIEDGTYPAGSKIPAIPELMRDYDVARETVRQAVTRLANEGLVTPLRGVGTVVRDTTPVQLGYTASAPARTWDVQTGEEKTSDRVIEAGWETADEDILARLQLPKGSQVVHRVRHMTRGQQIAQVVDQWIPDHVATAIANTTGDDLADANHQQSTDLYSQMTAAGHPPAWDEETIRSRMPDPDEVAVLELPVGVPVQITYRVTSNDKDQPLETATFVAASDRMSQTFRVPLHYGKGE